MKAVVTNLATKVGKTVTPVLRKALDAYCYTMSSEALDSADRLGLTKGNTPPQKKYQAHWGSDYGYPTTNEEVIEAVPSTTPQKKFKIHHSADYSFPTTNEEIAPSTVKAPSTQVGKVEKAPLTLAEATCIQHRGNW